MLPLQKFMMLSCKEKLLGITQNDPAENGSPPINFIAVAVYFVNLCSWSSIFFKAWEKRISSSIIFSPIIYRTGWFLNGNSW